MKALPLAHSSVFRNACVTYHSIPLLPPLTDLAALATPFGSNSTNSTPHQSPRTAPPPPSSTTKIGPDKADLRSTGWRRVTAVAYIFVTARRRFGHLASPKDSFVSHPSPCRTQLRHRDHNVRYRSGVEPNLVHPKLSKHRHPLFQRNIDAPPNIRRK